MKIDLGGGHYLEPDPAPRDTRYHRGIVAIRPMPNTRTGSWVDLDCGHRVMTFGRLELAGGKILCLACRDGAECAG